MRKMTLSEIEKLVGEKVKVIEDDKFEVYKLQAGLRHTEYPIGIAIKKNIFSPESWHDKDATMSIFTKEEAQEIVDKLQNLINQI